MMRFAGSSAPAMGAGPLGQLASLRVPARMAAAKLVTSIFLRPAASFGAMESPGDGSTIDVAGPAAGEAADAVSPPAESEVAVADALAGGVATSSAVTPDRGASAAQAAITSAVVTATAEDRTKDMS